MSNEMTTMTEDEKLASMLSTYEGSTGLEDGERFVSPPFARVVQAMSAELKEKFPEGTLVIPKLGIVVCAPKETISVTPVLMIPTYEAAIPYEKAPSGAPVTFYRTCDRNSEVAEVANRPDLDDRWIDVQHEGKTYQARAYENLVVVFFAHTGEAAGMPFIRSFAKSQFKYGKSMMNLAMFRSIGGKRPPLFWNRFNMTSFLDTDKQKKNKFWSTSLTQPEIGEPRFASPEAIAAFGPLHDKYNAEIRAIIAAIEDEEDASEPVEGASEPVEGAASM